MFHEIVWKIYFTVYSHLKKFLHIFYISYFDVMLKKNEFLWFFFLSKGFGEKCKHTELALNFVKKQNFS